MSGPHCSDVVFFVFFFIFLGLAFFRSNEGRSLFRPAENDDADGAEWTVPGEGLNGDDAGRVVLVDEPAISCWVAPRAVGVIAVFSRGRVAGGVPVDGNADGAEKGGLTAWSTFVW